MAEMKRRAPAGKSYDKCHGCGEAKLHYKGEVCRDCQEALKFGREVKAQFDSRLASLERVRLPAERWAMWAGETKETEQACALLVRALRLAFEPDPEKHYSQHYLLGRDGHDWWDTFLVPAAAVEPLKDLEKAIREAAQSEYDRGVEDGQNLLKQLATGAISNDRFDSVTDDLRRRAEERARRVKVCAGAAPKRARSSPRRRSG